MYAGSAMPLSWRSLMIPLIRSSVSSDIRLISQWVSLITRIGEVATTAAAPQDVAVQLRERLVVPILPGASIAGPHRVAQSALAPDPVGITHATAHYPKIVGARENPSLRKCAYFADEPPGSPRVARVWRGPLLPRERVSETALRDWERRSNWLEHLTIE